MDVFKYNDCDDEQLSLHDCVADKITYKNGVLSFYLPDGFKVMPNHPENPFDDMARTDAAKVDFLFRFPDIDKLENISVQVFKRSLFKRTYVEYWTAQKLVDAVNREKCTFEFIFPYKSYDQQMYHCALHFKKKPYYLDCQLYIPGTEAVYRWNELRPDNTW